MKDEKPNIYPPEFPDPLKPGGIPSSPDGSEKPAPYTYREENGIRIPTRKPLSGTVASEEDMLRDVPVPEGVKRDRYLGELARDNATDALCAACGKYLVKVDGFCPGCGAVR